MMDIRTVGKWYTLTLKNKLRSTWISIEGYKVSKLTVNFCVKGFNGSGKHVEFQTFYLTNYWKHEK